MILTKAENQKPEEKIRSLAKKVREQLEKEWENKKLESGVHVQWDSIDMAERIFHLTMQTVWNCDEDFSSEEFFSEMEKLIEEGWKPDEV